ncbi:hypothetical protein BO70DRAFT_60358 [Aspergillus heteromorphus CBS 117.55]|uniref:Uncharacterized protein n=1 Tax=Aspergillus heteromorphus CBS 117.55 TaxID=1448321 RepID=A0A317VY44_9EURO|nr:uncharacterized protein BO70DRAFT_60358 [Aspergillus heteromorphus CBS 117.55]PWY78251.1 hypothetical protein BO70DRAFT_60358 [Aspergillus heteromorphus CBS 117.55]
MHAWGLESPRITGMKTDGIVWVSTQQGGRHPGRWSVVDNFSGHRCMCVYVCTLVRPRNDPNWVALMGRKWSLVLSYYFYYSLFVSLPRRWGCLFFRHKMILINPGTSDWLYLILCFEPGSARAVAFFLFPWIDRWVTSTCFPTVWIDSGQLELRTYSISTIPLRYERSSCFSALYLHTIETPLPSTPLPSTHHHLHHHHLRQPRLKMINPQKGTKEDYYYQETAQSITERPSSQSINQSTTTINLSHVLVLVLLLVHHDTRPRLRPRPKPRTQTQPLHPPRSVSSRRPGATESNLASLLHPPPSLPPSIPLRWWWWWWSNPLFLGQVHSN